MSAQPTEALELESEARGARAGRIADAFVWRSENRRSWFECARCGHEYGAADQDPKLGTVLREGMIDELSPLNRWGLTEKLVVRFFYCPSCALLVAVDVQERGDAIMVETRLAAPEA